MLTCRYRLIVAVAALNSNMQPDAAEQDGDGVNGDNDGELADDDEQEDVSTAAQSALLTSVLAGMVKAAQQCARPDDAVHITGVVELQQEARTLDATVLQAKIVKQLRQWTALPPTSPLHALSKTHFGILNDGLVELELARVKAIRLSMWSKVTLATPQEAAVMKRKLLEGLMPKLRALSRRGVAGWVFALVLEHEGGAVIQANSPDIDGVDELLDTGTCMFAARTINRRMGRLAAINCLHAPAFQTLVKVDMAITVSIMLKTLVPKLKMNYPFNKPDSFSKFEAQYKWWPADVPFVGLSKQTPDHLEELFNVLTSVAGSAWAAILENFNTKARDLTTHSAGPLSRIFQSNDGM